MFRGRELSRVEDLGDSILARVHSLLEDIAVPEEQSELEGRRISLMYIAK